jgi:hypothetical protein
MSQRLNAGFNWARFSVGTSDKDCVFPIISNTGSDCFLFGFQRKADRSESWAIGQVGVGHPKQSLSDVRRADARSAQIGRPCGVSRFFQVSANKVEPTEAVLARNLFSKDNWRAALLDKSVELWPKVAFIGEPSSFSCGAKRLAGTRPGPNSAVVWPACEAKGQPPSPDTGEEMALIVADEVFRIHFANASLINVPVRYVSCRYQVS